MGSSHARVLQRRFRGSLGGRSLSDRAGVDCGITVITALAGCRRRRLLVWSQGRRPGLERFTACLFRVYDCQTQLPPVLGRRSSRGTRQRYRPDWREVPVDASDRAPAAASRGLNGRTRFALRLRHECWWREPVARGLSEWLGPVDARTSGRGVHPWRAGFESGCEAVPHAWHRSPCGRWARYNGDELLGSDAAIRSRLLDDPVAFRAGVVHPLARSVDLAPRGPRTLESGGRGLLVRLEHLVDVEEVLDLLQELFG